MAAVMLMLVEDVGVDDFMMTWIPIIIVFSVTNDLNIPGAGHMALFLAFL